MSKQGILSGIKVLELSTCITGPYAAKLMADNGAEVIKIEPPNGDVARSYGPFPNDVTDPEASGLFLTLNTSKEGITLDITKEEGKRLFLDLIGKVDTVIEDYKPGYLASLGLDYSELSRINPRLVMTSISNFGQSGPYSALEATELTFQAVRGLMTTIGDPERHPLKTGIPLAQYLAGVTAYTSTLAALYHAQNTGQGQQVDVAIADSIMCVLLVNAAMWSMDYPEKIERVRTGERHGPLVGIYQCEDGYIGSVVVNFDQLSRLADVISPELGDKERFGDLFWGTTSHPEELEVILVPWFFAHSKEEIVKIGQERDIAWCPVSTTKDIVENPHLRERHSLIELDHPKAGKHLYLVPPVRFPEIEYKMSVAPLLRQHNEEIFSHWLGLNEEQLEDLSKKGVV